MNLKQLTISNSRFQKAVTTVKTFIIGVMVLMLISPINLYAAMQSDSYIIYENINHSFDGPVISNVSDSGSGVTVTVTWDTSRISDGFVIYDTDASFSSSKEQGTSVRASTTHSVEVTGLDLGTYYYRVRSQSVNGGITTDTTTRTFTITTASGSTTPEPEETPVSGGGGMLIIDKTDKEEPEIINIVTEVLEYNEVKITWETNEESTSFVEYGLTTEYGKVYGNWTPTTTHEVVLTNLLSLRRYHFRVISSDDWGNIGYSEDDTFDTVMNDDEEAVEATSTEDIIEELPVEDRESLLEEITLRIREFITKLFPEVSLNELQNIDINNIDSLDDLANFVPAPILSGEPRLEIGATDVTISWITDVNSNSQVAIAPEGSYNPDLTEPYIQIVGNSEEQVTAHEVRVYGLTPNTDYHYQLRSKAQIGPIATSRDFTFRTSVEEIEITSHVVQVEDIDTAVFKWVTNKDSDSAIRFTPYQNNVLALDQSKTVRDNTMTTIHEVRISEFSAGVIYGVELISSDANANLASELIERFSTAEDDLPPEISHIKSDSTVFVDKSNKIQTVISWLTNEPSTSKVYYQEGVHGSSVELTESTVLNSDFSKDHVLVITKFKPGTVYTFRVESIDSGNNVTLSKPYTFMTAKKKESIIQVIMRILEDTFGWVKNIM